MHAILEREVHGSHSLLYLWKGSNPSRGEPILLMSHLDVVPVGVGDRTELDASPFSGGIADGFIWGQGTLDVKCGALGLLEAAERLLDGWLPGRPATSTVALGHDEELGGRKGTGALPRSCASRGVRFRFVLDEGGGLTEGIIDGIDGGRLRSLGLPRRGLPRSSSAKVELGEGTRRCHRRTRPSG